MFPSLRPPTAALVLLLALSTAASAQRPSRAALGSPLRAGDRIVVNNPADSVRREAYDLDADARVVLPRIGLVELGNVPAGLVSDTIRARYRRLQRTDDVFVEALRRISLVGDVHRPGVHYLDLMANARDAVGEAGGVTESGKTCCIAIMRNNATRLITDWQTANGEDLLLESGDVVMVPREPWVKRNVLAIVSGVAVLLSSVFLIAK